jgi:hypothetical protein
MLYRNLAARFALPAILCVLLVPTAAAQQPNLCPASKISEWRRSVVIAGPDKAIFTVPGADFSFSRAIGTILKSANVDDSPASRVAAVKSLVDSFKSDKATHPVDNRVVSVPVRNEGMMLAKDLLDPTNPNGMHPVGLFNRFDQAPGDAEYCGEHRIVYAQGDTSRNRTATGNRFFLIFEAAVDNPRTDLGKEGCRPIADLWQSLKHRPDPLHSTRAPRDAFRKPVRTSARKHLQTASLATPRMAHRTDHRPLCHEANRNQS